jgi:hypothetical protein
VVGSALLPVGGGRWGERDDVDGGRDLGISNQSIKTKQSYNFISKYKGKKN